MKLRPIIQKKNKKGQFETKLLAVVLIFVIAIIIFFMNHLNDQIYDSLDEWINESEHQNSTAQTTLEDIKAFEESNGWDYVVLAVFIGLVIQMVIFAFATRINIAFFWIFVLVAIVILVVGVALSNVWQEIVDEEEFSETILRFPITNSLLGTYYPTVVTFLLLIGLLVLFGKPPTQSLQ